MASSSNSKKEATENNPDTAEVSTLPPNNSNGGALNLLGLVEKHWHALFVLYGVWSVLTQKNAADDGQQASRWLKLKQVAGICCIGFLSFQLEKLVTKFIVKPLIDKYLVSNEQKEQQLQEMERKLRQRLHDREQKNKAAGRDND